MRREEKKKIIDELSEVFKNPVSILVIEYRGLDVKSMQSVREQVRETDSELRVVKNKFLLKACEGTEVEKIKDLFKGPTAIAICGEESPATTKVFTQARKQFEQLVVKGGLVDGKVCAAEDIEQISKLPSRQTLIAMFASTLAAPISNFASVLDRMCSRIYYALEALKQTKNGEGTAKKTAEKTDEGRNLSAKEGNPQGDGSETGTAEVKAEETESGKDGSPVESAPEKESSEHKNKKEENSYG